MATRYPLVLNGTTIQELQSGDTVNLGFTAIDAATKGQANGVASLDSSGLVPSTQLPSYVDDVLEYANLAAFPGTGETGKIYVAVDTSKTYRWSGSVYVEISASPGTSDALTEGSTNLYFTDARARAAVSATQNITYNSTTGVFTGPDLTSYLTSAAAASAYQPLDSDLTAFAGKTAPSGAVVGTTDTQTLTNKTINGASNTISNINLASQVTGTLPVANGGTGLTSFGAGIATFLGTPSSANLFAAMTDDTGTGLLVFNTTPTITGLRQTRVAVPASNIDLATGNYFTRTISGNTTLTVSNIPSSGTAASFILDLTNGGSATVNWFSGVKWAGGTAPTLTGAGRDVLGFFTHDGGTNWTGLVLGKDLK